ncbi:hypothetical protein HNP73_002767 [Amaricoccus macauensis]|uniref:Uncharacterized protein n=1 Tax=Amaricoccus macauensis TaxID=57001 RepID=A0A840SUL0_9RHOB|nr:hypothetical protein [Amaricoccus macauensis]MBB5222831.1 hypothetical protein [Amaricoccus macauensis]
MNQIFPELPEDFSHFRYWIGMHNDPILFVVNTRHQTLGALELDVKTNTFFINNLRIAECKDGRYADEIDEAEFERLVETHIAKYHEAKRKAQEAGKPWPEAPLSAADFLAQIPADPNRVVLQKRDSWIVDARLRENGDLAFCSGDTHREWYAIVPADRVEDLKSALIDKLGPDAPGTVLDLIRSRFSAPEDAPNPFEEIKAFLTRSGIAWVHDVW